MSHIKYKPGGLLPKMHPLEPPFRLGKEWYQWNTSRLQQKLSENHLNGILLTDVWNIIYFSGLFHTQTERPFWLFIPEKGKPVFFCPALDRDLVESWWIDEYEWYFDYPHHGPYNQIVYEYGPPADLNEWMLGCLAKRGYNFGVLGMDQAASVKFMRAMCKVLPNAELELAGDICLKMRMIKTPQELELLRKAVTLQDHLLEFGRALIIKEGCRATDFDIQQEMERYGTHLLMSWMDLEGKPHNGVGINFWITCRAGASTAYPHPNQFYYHEISRGDAIQLAGFVHLGGYVGEGYRAMQTNPITDLQKKVWEVHTKMAELQLEMSVAGTPCNVIASRVLKVARDAGLEEFIYHRPAHGIGMEGHQKPCISLGDETILEEGMVISNEPGLYSPRHGWGYNHSNTILITGDRGVILNKVPMTREWCWIDV